MKPTLVFAPFATLPDGSVISHLGIPLGIAVLVALIWAVRSDLRTWKKRSVTELITMVESNEWRQWRNALEELQRRGEELSRFIPLLVSRLVSDSFMARTAADATLKEFFPEFREQLKSYLPAQDPAVSRKKIEQLLASYGIL